MSDTLVTVLQVSGIIGAMGAIIGLVLAFASQIFHVETDPRYDLIVENLPGFNCGACGYPGCSGMAEGLLAGEANVRNCTPGNELTYAKVLAILKGEDPNAAVAEEKKPQTATDTAAKPKPAKMEIIDVTNDDPRFNKIVELLPGLNCTTCKEPGCKAFADALIKGTKVTNDCRPLNKKQEQKDEINKLLSN